MPTNQGHVNALFNHAILKLEKLIEGKAPELKVFEKVRGNKTVETFSVYVKDQVRDFNVHADCSVQSICQFIKEAKPDNLQIIKGPKKGRRITCTKDLDEGLKIYLK